MRQGHLDLEEGLHGWVGGQKSNRETIDHASENEKEVEYVYLWRVSTNILSQCPVLPLRLFFVKGVTKIH